MVISPGWFAPLHTALKNNKSPVRFDGCPKALILSESPPQTDGKTSIAGNPSAQMSRPARVSPSPSQMIGARKEC